MDRRYAWVVLSLFLAIAVPASAANHYILAGGTGSKSGADWSNACSDLTGSCAAGSMVRGDTYYVGDGSYASSNLTTPASGTSLITIKKATAADHGTATGWSSANGDGVATLGALDFSTSYWLVDGVTGGGPGNWQSGFGFKISFSGATPLLRVGTNSNVTVRHIELQGTSNSSGGGSIAQDALAVYGGANVTLSYFYTHAIGRCPFFLVPAPDITVEYGYIGDFVSTSAAHSELMSAWNWSNGDVTFRYNIVTYITGTGGIMWDNSGNHNSALWIYGNVFYRPTSVTWDEANGIIGGWTGANGEDFYNTHVYNNTFINVNQASLSTLPTRFGNNVAYNNIWYNSDAPDFGRFGTHNYDHFVSSGGTASEPNGTSSASGIPFVNLTNLDFHLLAPTSAGTTLAAPYNKDPDGAIRGSSGVWSRGAYQFAGVAPPNPNPPTNLISSVN